MLIGPQCLIIFRLDGIVFFKWDSVLTCKYQHLCVVCLYSTAITGVCYVRLVKTIWVAAGTEEAAMYDPKSGENVSVLYIK